MSLLVSKKGAISNRNLKLAAGWETYYERSSESNECTVISMDVAGDSQGKGHHVAQGVEHMMNKK